MKKLWFAEYDSPVGPLLIAGFDETLAILGFEDYYEQMNKLLLARFGEYEFTGGSGARPIVERLDRYFHEGVETFSEIRVEMHGSPLQNDVWTALRSIPAGETRSYGQLAAKLGRPKASRAVGHANAVNPVAIVVPCHRVIGASGRLTGYGGGLERKEWLLKHEQRFYRGAPAQSPLFLTA
jgi:O-6-methylguanine DNA methyltransferase